MKIVYFANFGNKNSDSTEEHIAYSLNKLGHIVFKIPESTPEMIPKDCDLFLFHKGGFHLDRALKRVNYPKVFWYFDKIWHGREDWMRQVTPRVDFGFLTDETWLKAHPSEKMVVLRQGIGNETNYIGKPDPARFRGKIAFTGSVYKGREEFIETLRKTFGNDFQIYNNVFGRDLYDLCATIPIILAPPFPSDDFYWSSRIYMVLGSGGFLVHPRLAGLKECDGLIDGVHYAGYNDEFEMIEQIRHYLVFPKKRKEIQMQGYKYVTKELNYTNRCQKLLEILAQNSIGTYV